jgi:hypothetical protein
VTRIISRAESWERAYIAFQNVNFSSFDFNTIKQSLIDYVKLYFPEDFNDYIESSEFIAILELFAYVGELLMYRVDMNSQENFLSTAQRKQSVLRLAKLISYNPSRNIPARGLTKITSITTTEQVFDTNGINLSNTKITWNDPANSNWKDQFLLVMNRVLQQDFGTVAPSDRIQVDDVLFELYTFDNNTILNGVFPFSTTVSGENVPMELVPSSLNEFGPYEKRPEANTGFTLLYGNDGLGDSSDTTGFFFFAKQGSIQKLSTTFDGVTPNQTFDIEVDDINNTDVWVNNVDGETDEILVDPPVVVQGLESTTSGRYGAWNQVDLAHSENIIYNTNPNRNKYEIETLEDDQVRLIFGDGEFSDIPTGSFDLWFRTSLNKDIVIPQNSVVNETSSFPYQGDAGNTQTLSFTFSLINGLQNASPSEDIDHVRRVAPTTYYTQDRMVNNRDYNTFMLQDPTILKLRAVNRTYAGDSKYIAWHDPSETYENVKMFGDDLLLYYKDSSGIVVVDSPVNGTTLIANYITPLLSTTDFYTFLVSEGMPQSQFRTSFTESENTAILSAIDDPSPPTSFTLYYSIPLDEWTVGINPLDDTSYLMMTVDPVIVGGSLTGWTITYITRHLIAESETMRFWNTNSADRVINYDTLNAQTDQIILLNANIGYDLTVPASEALFTQDWVFEVLGIEDDELNPGLQNIHQLSVLPQDDNGDLISDFDNMPEIIDLKYDYDVPPGAGSPIGVIDITTLPRTYLLGQSAGEELQVYAMKADGTQTLLVRDLDWTEQGTGTLSQAIRVGMGSPVAIIADWIRIVMKDYVYFTREDDLTEWTALPTTDTVKLLWAADQVGTIPVDGDTFKREHGRGEFNFGWFHETVIRHLVDPAASNIIDTFIISRGYFTSLRDYLDEKTTVVPTAPTSLQLRTDYNYMLDNKMISDTVILHSGLFKVLFGQFASSDLQGTFKVVRDENGILTDNQVKVRIVDVIKEFFDVNKWNFGQTFFFTELAAFIHADLSTEIDSVVLVPTFPLNQFGDLFQVYAREDQVLQPSIAVSDIEVVTDLNSLNMRQNPS